LLILVASYHYQKPPKKYVHIIVGPPVGINKSVRSLEEVLSVILQNIPTKKIKTTKKTIKIPEKMPLKERDTSEALMVFNSNVTKSFDPTTSKSNFNFLVCSGAAGIGTHFVFL